MYRYRATEAFWASFYRLSDPQKETTRRAWEIFKRAPFDPRLRTHNIHDRTPIAIGFLTPIVFLPDRLLSSTHGFLQIHCPGMRQVPENLGTVPLDFCNPPLGMYTVPQISGHPPLRVLLALQKLDSRSQDLDTGLVGSRSSRANFRANSGGMSHFGELPGLLGQ